MSHTVKTYGRRHAGVAFPSSRAAPQNVFSSSPSPSSDGNTESPLPSAAAGQRRKKRLKPDVENAGIKGHSQKGTSKTLQSVPVKSQSSYDSGQPQTQPRRPLADVNRQTDTVHRAALPEKPRKLRCRNRRKTIKASVGSLPIASKIPDFSDIENHSLFIVNEDCGDCVVVAAEAAGTDDEPSEECLLFSPSTSSSRRVMTRSQCQAVSAAATSRTSTTSVTREREATASATAACHDWSQGSKTKPLCMDDGEPSHSRLGAAAAAITPLHSHRNPSRLCSGVAVSTPQAHVTSTAMPPTLDDEANVSAIAECNDSADDSPYQIMTRSRLQQLRSGAVLDTSDDCSGGGCSSSSSSGACHCTAASQAPRLASSSGLPSSTPKAPEADSLRQHGQQQQAEHSEQSAALCGALTSNCRRTRSTRSASTTSRNADGASINSSSGSGHRSTRQGTSTLSTTNGGTMDKLESIAEVVHAEDGADTPSLLSFVALGTPKSMLKLRGRCLQSPERRSLAEIFPTTELVSDVAVSEEYSATAEELLAGATPRDLVLRECGQDDYVPFADVLLNCDTKVMRKVGEGVFGEVFLLRDSCGNENVIKIVPIEGDFKVNDEPQKTFDEILPEIVISRELSNLDMADEPGAVDACCNYIHLASVLCAQGKYPQQLKQAWNKYSKERGSENDCPSVFGRDQLFIIFEFENGGTDLESFQFTSLAQGLSVLRQVAYALAVAEGALQFEHRDLHWGNVLVKAVDDPAAVATYAIGGHIFSFPANGVYAKIIDYTLSRLEKDGRTIFMDLSTDESLFTGKGDYQFEIYRKMKEHNENDWEPFDAYSNVLWIHYLADKIANAKVYPRSQQTSEYREQMRDLRKFLKRGFEYVSALHIVLQDSLFVTSV